MQEIAQHLEELGAEIIFVSDTAIEASYDAYKIIIMLSSDDLVHVLYTSDDRNDDYFASVQTILEMQNIDDLFEEFEEDDEIVTEEELLEQ
jgi:hypothetical protein